MPYNHYCNNFQKFIIYPLIISAILLCSLTINRCHAQIALDGSMGTNKSLVGPDFKITDDLGQIHGSNLFHSFSEFNILKGQSATFSGPNSITNILSRVTGGNHSLIDGTLTSKIPGANLYLFNPSGVLFGANASLNIQGSFHVSTADYLRFSDGAEFHADLSKGSTLTVAPLAAFGFLGNNPASITIQNSKLDIPKGETLSVIGGDISIIGGDFTASGGQINIASVASPGEVVPNVPGDTQDLNVDSFSSLGKIDLSNGSYIDAGGDGGGSVVIRGGRFIMDDSEIGPYTTGVGARIDIQVTNDVILDNGSHIGTIVGKSAAPGLGSGGVRVKADSLEVANSSAIRSEVIKNSAGGKGGDIDIDTNSVLLRDKGSILSDTLSSGDGSKISVNTEGLEIRNGGQIHSSASEGTGNAGDINIEAESILMSDNKPKGQLTMIKSETIMGTGNSGDMKINTNSLHISSAKELAISNITTGSGQGGKTDITVSGDVYISGTGDDNIHIGIFTNTFGSGTGGALNLTANNLELTDAASIQTATFGDGIGGDLFLTATNSIKLTNGAFITGRTTGFGNAGNTSISAGQDVLLSNGALISAKSSGTGNAGNIAINAGNLFKSSGSSVTTESNKADGGNINLTSGQLTHLKNSEIKSSVNGGPDTVGGNITMDQPYGIMENSKIVANAFEGRGGNIMITANVFIADPNSVVSASSAKGVDGEVDIRATVKNISANTGTLKEDFSSANSLLLEPCAVRRSNENQSSLVVAGRDGLPARPGDLLPSPLYDTDMANADAAVAVALDMPPLAYGINFFEDKGLLPLDMLEGDTGCATCPK